MDKHEKMDRPNKVAWAWSYILAIVFGIPTLVGLWAAIHYGELSTTRSDLKPIIEAIQNLVAHDSRPVTEPAPTSTLRRNSDGNVTKESHLAKESPLTNQAAPIPNSNSLPPTTPTPDDGKEIACPPPGTLTAGWNILSLPEPPGSTSYGMMSEPDPQINSTIRGLVQFATPPFDSSRTHETNALFSELKELLPKPKSIPTPGGAIPAEKIVVLVGHSFTINSNNIRVGSETRLGSEANVRASKEETTISIDRLSGQSRRAIQDFDEFSRSQADVSCVDALHRLTTKQKTPS